MSSLAKRGEVGGGAGTERVNTKGLFGERLYRLK